MSDTRRHKEKRQLKTAMYPRLASLVRLIALDNNMRVRKRPIWPDESVEMEKIARSLNSNSVSKPSLFHHAHENEFDIMTTGEDSDARALIESKGLEKLDKFLDEVFDGEYAENFWAKR